MVQRAKWLHVLLRRRTCAPDVAFSRTRRTCLTHHAQRRPFPLCLPDNALATPPSGLQDGSMSNLAGKDYRVLRACSPFQAFGAPMDPRSGGHTCYK